MSRSFDLLVIGGGITGCGIAWDAQLRGLSTILVERADFGAGTSAGCFKIAHGGLRYLQHLNFPRLLESGREQTTLRRISNCFLRPFEMLVPSDSSLLKNKLSLTSAMCVYEALQYGRNKGFDVKDKLKSFRIVDQGVIYSECAFTNSERYTWLVAKSAEQAGADINNYTEIRSLERVKNGIWEAMLSDGRKVTARYLVRATGRVGEGPMSKGVQIAIRGTHLETGVAFESAYSDPRSVLKARSYFLYPWNKMTLVGTTDSIEKPPVDGFRVTEGEITELLEVAKAACKKEFQRNDVCWSFGGYRLVEPGAENLPDGAAKVAHREHIRVGEHEASVVGVKYTTFRSVAERVVDQISEKLGSKAQSKTACTNIWSSPEDIDVLRKEISDERMVGHYGEVAREVIKKGEVEALAEDETVRKLEDLLFRRSVLGFDLDETTLRQMAARYAECRNLGSEDIENEISGIKKLRFARLVA